MLVGVAPAKDVKSVSACPGTVGVGFGLQMTVNEGEDAVSYVFSVDDDDERDEWVDSIEFLIE